MRDIQNVYFKTKTLNDDQLQEPMSSVSTLRGTDGAHTNTS